jgi:hypothetical protein
MIQEGLDIDRSTKEANMANNKPVHQIRLSAIRAAIWINVSEKTGETWFTVTVTRSYRDKEQLKDTSTFRRDDLPIVSKVVEMAYTWIWEQSAPNDSEVVE